MHSQTVLVTGAGGFIGSHLCEHLVRVGAGVRAFVRYNARADWGLLKLLPSDVLDSIEVVAGDLRDSDATRQAVQGCETVFHLGALIAIPYSYQHPREVVETNVMGTLNVLMAAREANVQRVVHTSTSEVYGTALYTPIDENHPLQGQSPYSASKIGADKLVESFYRSFDLPVVTVRPFNTYGPRQSARAVIPTIISQMLQKDEIRLGDLTPKRDLTFVTDTAAAFLYAAQRPNIEGQVINLGANETISIGDLAQKIMALMGKTVTIVTDEARLRPQKSEVLQLWSNNQLASELLGWHPQVTLDEGLQQTIAWIAAHPHYYNISVYQV